MDIPLKTNYQGYVSWGEYPHNFAAVLDQEEIFRLLIAKGCNCDLKVRSLSLSPRVATATSRSEDVRF